MNPDNKYKLLYQQELNPGQYIFLSWNIFRANFYILLLTSIILFLPFFIVSGFEASLPIPILVLLRFAELTVSAIFSLACYTIITSYLKGKEITISQAIVSNLPNLGKGVWTLILSTLIIIVLSLLIIPGIIWAIYYTFAVYVVAAKGIGGKGALDYSKGLVRGRWWKVLAYILLIGLLIILATIIVSVPLALLLTNEHVYLLFAAMFAMIVATFYSTAAIVLFINLDYSKTGP